MENSHCAEYLFLVGSNFHASQRIVVISSVFVMMFSKERMMDCLDCVRRNLVFSFSSLNTFETYSEKNEKRLDGESRDGG